MHQVLSYETAVRANDLPEFREYITKRTCVSIFLTIAFITLIVGYLLGNFVAERKLQMRQIQEQFANCQQSDATNNSIEIGSSDYMSLQELHVYTKAKEKLLHSAANLSRLLHQHNKDYKAGSINTDIFNKYISCTQNVEPTTNVEAAEFIERLIDNTAARQRNCLRIIQSVLDNNLNPDKSMY